MFSRDRTESYFSEGTHSPGTSRNVGAASAKQFGVGGLLVEGMAQLGGVKAALEMASKQEKNGECHLNGTANVGMPSSNEAYKSTNCAVADHISAAKLQSTQKVQASCSPHLKGVGQEDASVSGQQKSRCIVTQGPEQADISKVNSVHDGGDIDCMGSEDWEDMYSTLEQQGFGAGKGQSSSTEEDHGRIGQKEDSIDDIDILGNGTNYALLQDEKHDQEKRDQGFLLDQKKHNKMNEERNFSMTATHALVKKRASSSSTQEVLEEQVVQPRDPVLEAARDHWYEFREGTVPILRLKHVPHDVDVVHVEDALGSHAANLCGRILVDRTHKMMQLEFRNLGLCLAAREALCRVKLKLYYETHVLGPLKLAANQTPGKMHSVSSHKQGRQAAAAALAVKTSATENVDTTSLQVLPKKCDSEKDDNKCKQEEMDNNAAIGMDCDQQALFVEEHDLAGQGPLKRRKTTEHMIDCQDVDSKKMASPSSDNELPKGRTTTTETPTRLPSFDNLFIVDQQRTRSLSQFSLYNLTAKALQVARLPPTVRGSSFERESKKAGLSDGVSERTLSSGTPRLSADVTPQHQCAVSGVGDTTMDAETVANGNGDRTTPNIVPKSSPFVRYTGASETNVPAGWFPKSGYRCNPNNCSYDRNGAPRRQDNHNYGFKGRPGAKHDNRGKGGGRKGIYDSRDNRSRSNGHQHGNYNKNNPKYINNHGGKRCGGGARKGNDKRHHNNHHNGKGMGNHYNDRWNGPLKRPEHGRGGNFRNNRNNRNRDRSETWAGDNHHGDSPREHGPLSSPRHGTGKGGNINNNFRRGSSWDDGNFNDHYNNSDYDDHEDYEHDNYNYNASSAHPDDYRSNHQPADGDYNEQNYNNFAEGDFQSFDEHIQNSQYFSGQHQNGQYDNNAPIANNGGDSNQPWDDDTVASGLQALIGSSALDFLGSNGSTNSGSSTYAEQSASSSSNILSGLLAPPAVTTSVPSAASSVEDDWSKVWNEIIGSS
ncbi:unnamed protein product [Amoebophrya sp. A25]|nr:unnamed protein product [Amoebophrya sp. A25]|eukprot:GSA25T00001737001.1